MTETKWTHAHTFTLPAAAPHVFRAWTDAVELQRWFAEHVAIEAREGGVFRFWGRCTYGVPTEKAATGRIVRFERDVALSFDWQFDGVPSRVTLEFKPDPKGNASKSHLALQHAFDGRLGIAYQEELIDDLWRLTCGNLDAHLRGGEGIVIPDYTDPDPEVRLSIVIDAPRELVFRALIEPEALKRWVGAPAAVVEPRVGGRYEYGWQYDIKGMNVTGGPTKILDIVPNERLVTDWLDWRGDTTRAPTRLAWLLESVGTKTRLTLVHGGFERIVDQSDYPFGWRWYLDQLKKEAESSSGV